MCRRVEKKVVFNKNLQRIRARASLMRITTLCEGGHLSIAQLLIDCQADLELQGPDMAIYKIFCHLVRAVSIK